MSRPPVILIAAVSRNGVIGNNGKIPWLSKADINHFATTTLNQCVVMGHKTFISIGRPLSRRMNIVVTSQTSLSLPGCDVRSSFTAGLAAANERPCQQIYIIGGAQIYRQALPYADGMVLSRMQLEVVGDTCFPEFEVNDWQLDYEKNLCSKTPAFVIEHWRRTRQ